MPALAQHMEQRAACRLAIPRSLAPPVAAVRRAGGPAAALQTLGALPAQLPPGGGSPGGALVLHNAVVFSDGAGGMQVGVRSVHWCSSSCAC